MVESIIEAYNRDRECLNRLRLIADRIISPLNPLESYIDFRISVHSGDWIDAKNHSRFDPLVVFGVTHCLVAPGDQRTPGIMDSLSESVSEFSNRFEFSLVKDIILFVKSGLYYPSVDLTSLAEFCDMYRIAQSTIEVLDIIGGAEFPPEVVERVADDIRDGLYIMTDIKEIDEFKRDFILPKFHQGILDGQIVTLSHIVPFLVIYERFVSPSEALRERVANLWSRMKQVIFRCPEKTFGMRWLSERKPGFEFNSIDGLRGVLLGPNESDEQLVYDILSRIEEYVPQPPHD